MTKDYGENFNVAHIEPLSHIYGPGNRFVVWVQGCSLACNGCWNKDMWSFKPNELIHRDVLLRKILNSPDIQGVTLLGGEPLHQIKNVIWLFQQIRSQSDLTLFLYTGYEEVELEQMECWGTLNTMCDMIAIGRYRQEVRNIQRQWVGSDNQHLKFPENSRQGQQLPENRNEVEIIISENCEVRILGFPDHELLKQYTRD